jgi:predicted DNA-binding transcriptional regulator YafY
MGSAKSHETVWRHWLILQRIPRKRFIGTRELQNSLRQAGVEVSLRTVQRDLIELSCLEFPLISDEAPIKGWRWAEDASYLEIPGMDPFTALTFMMAKLHLGTMMPESCLSFLNPHMSKAREVLRGLEGAGVGGWPKKIARISRHLSLQPPQINAQHLSAVYDGLLMNQQVELLYKKRGKEEPDKYTVTPLGVVFTDATLYLVCNFADKRGIYKLALHRIMKAKCLDQASTPIDGFDLQDYIEEGGFEFTKDEGKVSFSALFEKKVAEHLDETPLSDDQVVTVQDDGWVKVEATVRNSPQLQWWVMGFGDKVEVLEPQDLRQQVAEACQNMCQMYKQ